MLIDVLWLRKVVELWSRRKLYPLLFPRKYVKWWVLVRVTR